MCIRDSDTLILDHGNDADTMPPCICKIEDGEHPIFDSTLCQLGTQEVLGAPVADRESLD